MKGGTTLTKLSLILSTGLCFLLPPEENLDIIETQQNEIDNLETYISELEEENKRLVDTINTSEVVEVYYPEQPSVMKTFMDYRAITSTSSKQYFYRENGYTLSDGLRAYDDRIQIALGTPYAQVGDKVDVFMESGEVIRAIVADSKGDRYFHQDGSTLEFLVDSDVIPDSYRGRYGLDYKYQGYIKSFEILK